MKPIQHVINIEDQDVKKALEAIKHPHALLTQCCVLYQCAKRHGLPIRSIIVSFGYMKDGSEFEIDHKGRAFTLSFEGDWDQLPKGPVTLTMTGRKEEVE